MTQSGFSIAVVGATGAVGRELFSVLSQRNFPVREVRAFSSPRSQGKKLELLGHSTECHILEKGCFRGTDFVFFDASDGVSKEWVPQAAEEGAWVIDNSAAFRLDSDIPLIVPEVNGHVLRSLGKNPSLLSARQRIIAGPNCSTAQLVVALKPLHEKWGIERVIVATYQSASGAGSEAMNELSTQTLSFLEKRSFEPKAFTHQIAFNCIPQIGGFLEDGSTSEENKIRLEAKKILDLPNLKISATAVRVPTFACHGEAVHVELTKDCSPEEARKAFSVQSGCTVIDDPAKKLYPMGLTHPGDLVPSGTGADPVFVGRIRRDPAFSHGLSFWIISDNLRKGAALNAVQIGEALLAQIRG